VSSPGKSKRERHEAQRAFEQKAEAAQRHVSNLKVGEQQQPAKTHVRAPMNDKAPRWAGEQTRSDAWADNQESSHIPSSAEQRGMSGCTRDQVRDTVHKHKAMV
jgi:hypothetical protein